MCSSSRGNILDKPLGTIGDVGIFSLTETKNISCGEGGLLVTNNLAIAKKSRLIRNHGEGVVDDDWSNDELVNVIGMNYRLTELQAAVAIPQVESLIKRNNQRKKLTKYLLDGLSVFRSNLIPPVIEKGIDYCCYMLKLKWIPYDGLPTRDELVSALLDEGIPVGKGYGRMMHENPIFTRKLAYTNNCPFDCLHTDSSRLNYGSGTLPISEEINKQFIWFKYINPPNTENDMDDVISHSKKFLNSITY